MAIQKILVDLDVDGDITSDSFIKDGGSSNQFLKADGSVDSSPYVTSSGNTIIGTDTDINTNNAQVIDTLVMTDGVITSHSIRTMTLAQLGYTGANNANNYVHPSYASTNINTSGSTIVDIITTNSTGHVTNLGTRTLTLADIGFTGASNANYITNNNQLTNGAGYITAGGNTTYTAGNGLSLSGTEFRMAGGSIGGSVNLNTYLSSGYYVQGSNANATSGTNYPTNNAGILTVVRAQGNTTHVTQTYDQYNSNAFYNRSYYGGTWSTWRNLAQDTNTVYTHPGYATTNINTSGSTIVDSITTNSTGHITGMGTRVLTLANIGFTGDANANYITNNNQLTNGAGYITSSGNSQLSDEQVEDIMGAAWISGTNNTFVYDDSAGTLRINSANDNTIYTHPTYNGDDMGIDTGALTGAVVISDIDLNVNTDTLGHVTDANATVATRTLTLADLGYTGDADANKYVLPFTNNSSNWNTAYSWGDHSTEGYLTNADIGGFVDGNGTANKIPKWTDSDTIGNSIITEVSSKIGIGVASPKAALHVNGAVIIGNDTTAASADLAGALRYWDENNGGEVTAYVDMCMKHACGYEWVNIVTNRTACL